MSSTSISLPSVPCCDYRLICMRSYAEPVDMAVEFDEAKDTTSAAHYITTSTT